MFKVPHVVIPPSTSHTSTVIFLHGLGDTGHGWASAMSEIKPAHTKVILPTAPTIPVTINAGAKMPSWFDLHGLNPNTPEDEAGLNASTEKIHSIINEEIALGIPSNRIVLGGFSQGGGLALYAGLRMTKSLGGIVALSCWLPMFRNFPDPNLKCSPDVPIFMCHGDCDPVVPFKWGQASYKVIRSFMNKCEFHTYPGLMHSSNQSELNDIKGFLERILHA